MEIARYPVALVDSARAYVDKQIAIMAEHGSAPSLTLAKYEALVLQIVKITIKAKGGKAITWK